MVKTAGVFFVLAWVFWFHRWVPALLVVAFVVWMAFGDTLHRRWRHAWPPRPLLLTALLIASALVFALYDAPLKAKLLPIALNVLALSVIFAGAWWSRIALPQWLGGDGPSPFLAPMTAKGERP